jgi:hypothetical protein
VKSGIHGQEMKSSTEADVGMAKMLKLSDSRSNTHTKMIKDILKWFTNS